MNEFGEPNMGNPSVRFDEGREQVGHWPLAFHSNGSCLLYKAESECRAKTQLWYAERYSLKGERDPGVQNQGEHWNYLCSLCFLLFSEFAKPDAVRLLFSGYGASTR